MSTALLYGLSDAWYSLYNGGTNLGNGSGPRLQCGYAVDSGGNTWENRLGIGFKETIMPHTVTASQITSAVIRVVVRGTHSCFAQGSHPAFFIERVADATYVISENDSNVECGGGGGGHGSVGDERWGGPTTTTTNRVFWDSTTVGAGDEVDIDVTQLFKDWWNARTFGSGDYFCVVFKAATTSGSGYDETTQARKIAFNAQNGNTPIYNGGTGPDMVITYTTNTAPAAPSSSISPNGTTRQVGTASRTFGGNYADTEDNAANLGPSSIEIIVVDNNNATSGGVLSGTHLTLTPAGDSGSGITYNASTKVWSQARTFTQTRGHTYYWQVRVKDQGGLQSGWSAVFSYPVNQLPTYSKVNPG